MLADLDRLMRQRGVGASVVSMHENLDPSFRWLTRGAKVTKGFAIKKVGDEPLLLHFPMERDEAAAAGVPTRSVFDFDWNEIFRREPDPGAAYADFFAAVFSSLGVEGSVAFYGFAPVNLYFPIFEGLEKRGWNVYRSSREDLFQLARKTKEPWEIAEIASVGRRTEEVVARVRDVLRKSEQRDGDLYFEGNLLKIGYLKDLVSAEIYRLGMIEDHETILSQGRDAAIPHSRGDRNATVRTSSPIIIDIFPADRASGYFFDLTRTFCVGPVPERLRFIHGHVREAHARAAAEMRVGALAKEYQALVCDLFEAEGFETTRSNPTTHNGYVHSLGHGVGLQVHELPFFHLSSSNEDPVEVGDILTIEPGLYFPDEGIGVRIEDTFVIEEGGARSLSDGDRGLAP
jgi:Xaa-Pro aminopeptidase